jgi:EcsC protein family
MVVVIEDTTLEAHDFSDVERAALRAAIKRLEEPGFAGKMTTLAGRPAELVARALPRPAASVVATAAAAALTQALDIALFSLRDRRFIGGRVLHSALASASGAVGGAFGLAALLVQLPVSTAIMLRTTAEIARKEGEGLAAPDGAEAGYFALRVLLARGLALAADTLVRKGAAHGNSVLMHRALAPIVARFTAHVSQKVALQGMAVIGAVGGAAVNLAFIQQYQGLRAATSPCARWNACMAPKRCVPNTTSSRRQSSTNRCRQLACPRRRLPEYKAPSPHRTARGSLHRQISNVIGRATRRTDPAPNLSRCAHRPLSPRCASG